MAIIDKSANFMGLPMNIARGNPMALDTTEIWYSLSELETYAKSGATAYVGQIVQLVDEVNKTATAYIIANVDGDLVEVGSSTLGDNKTIELTEDGILRLVGSADAKKGAQLTMGANGTIEWIVPDTNTVAGLQSAVAQHTSDIAAHEERLDTAEEDIDALQLKVSSLGDIFNFVGVKSLDDWSNTKAEDYDVGDVFLVENKEYVCVEIEVEGVKTKKWEPLGDPDGVSTLQSEVSTLKGKVSTLENWQVGANSSLTSMSGDIDGLKSKDTELTNELALKATNVDLATERGRITALNTTVEGIQESITGINTSLSQKAATTYVDGKVSELNQSIAKKADQSALNDLANNTATNEDLEQGLAGKVDNSTYNEKMTALDTAIGNNKTTADAAKATADQNKTDIAELKTSVAGKASASAVEELAGRVGTNETNIGTLTQNYNTLNGTVTALSSGKADKTELTPLSENIAKNAKAIEDHAAQYTTLEGRVTKAEGDVVKAQGDATQALNNAAAASSAAGAAQAKAEEVLGAEGDAASANTVFGAKAAAAEAKAAAEAAQDAADAAQGDVDTLEQTVANLDAAYKSSDDALGARIKAVEDVIGGVQGAMHFVGVSITDPSTGIVTINGKDDYEPANGDVVIYEKKEVIDDAEKVVATVEFVYSDNVWVELGDVSAEAKRIGALEERMEAAEVETAKVVGIENSITAINSAASALEARVKANEDGIKAHGSAIEALQTRASTIEQNLTKTASDIRGELASAVSSLEDKITAESSARSAAVTAINEDIAAINALLTWSKFSS